MVCWAIEAVFYKVAATKLGLASSWIWLATFIPSMVLMGWLVVMSNKIGVDRGGLIFLTLSMVCAMAGGYFYYILFTRTEMAVGLPFVALYPILVVIVGVVFMGEKLGFGQIVGIVLGMVSVYLLASA